MTLFFAWLLSNAITASVLALVAYGVSKVWPRRPALAHACWILVLVKLLTPPLYVFPFSLPAGAEVQAQAVEPRQSDPVANAILPPASSETQTPPAETNFAELPGLPEANASSEKAERTIPADTPPPVLVPTNQPSTSTIPPAPVSWMQSAYEMWALRSNDALFCLQIVTISGSSLLILLTVARILRFERLLRLAQPASHPLREMTEQLGRVLNLNRVPTVLVVPGKVGPLLWQRWSEPVIVLPEGLLESINNQELQTVLVHELTHYRRGDHLWRYLELAAVAFYWWLPSAWWASRRLRQAEEECCDAGVVASLPDGVASYETALIRSLTFVAEPNSPCPALSSGLGPVTLLKRRLKMLHTKVERRLGVRGWLLLMAVAAIALPVGISWADDDTPPPARRETRRSDDARRDDARSERTRQANSRDVVPPVDEDGRVSVPAVPARPVNPARPAQGAAAPLPPHNSFAGAAPAALPSSFSPFGQGAAAGMSAPAGMQGPGGDDMRSNMEMAVRQAELDLKARRIKVRQAESGLKLNEMELTKIRKLHERGTVDSSEVAQSQAKVDNARAELELAQVEVERGELSVEQVKRRMVNLPRSGQQPVGGMASMNTTPMPPGSGFSPVPGGGGASAGSAPRGPGGPGGGGVPGGPGGAGGPGAFGGGGLGGGLGSGPFGGASGPLGGGSLGGMGGAGSGRNSLSGGLSSDAFFRNFDKANTGKIRREDVPDWMRDRFFEMIDTNKDGVVDREEFSANYNRLWENNANRGRGGVSTVRGGRGEGSGRAETTIRGEGARGEGGRGDTAPTINRRGEADPRDERIQQLEKELRDMRKALEDLRKREPGAVR